jgi:hypothetical protein
MLPELMQLAPLPYLTMCDLSASSASKHHFRGGCMRTTLKRKAIALSLLALVSIGLWLNSLFLWWPLI